LADYLKHILRGIPRETSSIFFNTGGSPMSSVNTVTSPAGNALNSSSTSLGEQDGGAIAGGRATTSVDQSRARPANANQATGIQADATQDTNAKVIQQMDDVMGKVRVSPNPNQLNGGAAPASGQSTSK
jgi:hypothetical protein